MLKIDHDCDNAETAFAPSSPQEITAENVSLRLLLTQAKH
jgi:hypothetical protein